MSNVLHNLPFRPAAGAAILCVLACLALPTGPAAAGEPSLEDAIRDFKSGHAGKMMATVGTLAKSKDAQAWKAIKEACLSKETMAKVQACTKDWGWGFKSCVYDFLNAIAEGDPDRAAPILIAMARDFSEKDDRLIRGAIVRALGKIQRPSREILEVLGERLDDTECECVAVLASWGTSESMAVLNGKELLEGLSWDTLIDHRNNLNVLEFYLRSEQSAKGIQQFMDGGRVQVVIDHYDFVRYRAFPTRGRDGARLVTLLSKYGHLAEADAVTGRRFLTWCRTVMDNVFATNAGDQEFATELAKDWDLVDCGGETVPVCKSSRTLVSRKVAAKELTADNMASVPVVNRYQVVKGPVWWRGWSNTDRDLPRRLDFSRNVYLLRSRESERCYEISPEALHDALNPPRTEEECRGIVKLLHAGSPMTVVAPEAVPRLGQALRWWPRERFPMTRVETKDDLGLLAQEPAKDAKGNWLYCFAAVEETALVQYKYVITPDLRIGRLRKVALYGRALPGVPEHAGDFLQAMFGRREYNQALLGWVEMAAKNASDKEWEEWRKSAASIEMKASKE